MERNEMVNMEITFDEFIDNAPIGDQKDFAVLGLINHYNIEHSNTHLMVKSSEEFYYDNKDYFVGLYMGMSKEEKDSVYESVKTAIELVNIDSKIHWM